MTRKDSKRTYKRILFSFFLLFIAVGVDAQFGEPILISDSPYGPRGYSADIDGDGDLDVIYSENLDGSVYWFENLGEGNFSPRQLITAEGFVNISLLPADLDGDGDIDFLTWDHGSLLVWHDNSGAGNFSAGQILTTGGTTKLRNVSILDIDGDGDLDILFTDNYHVYLVEQTGTGTFADAIVIIENEVNIETALLNYAHLDVDNDGLKDIVLSKLTTGLGWCRNTGNNTFEPFEIIDPTVEFEMTGTLDRALEVFDFNGDGNDDLFYANVNTIWVFENMSGGLFQPGMEILSLADNSYSIRVSAIEIGHFDDNENPDLFISSYNIPLTQGNDTFPAIYQFEYDGSEFAPVNEMITDLRFVRSIELQDFDQDGDSDILAFSPGENVVKILKNTDGIFDTESIELSDGLAGIIKTLAIDIDGDFDLDILVASQHDGKISWYERDDTGSYLPQKIITDGLWGVDIFLAEDLDQDGDLDLIISDLSDEVVYWMENNGDGTFTNTHFLSDLTSSDPTMDLEDLNNDGILDVVYTGPSNSFNVVKGLGNGVFSPFQSFGATPINGGIFQDHTIFDMDEDGFMDIVGYFITSEDERQIGWYKNDGDGNFPEFFYISFLGDGHQLNTQIVHSDLNQDGLPDLITLSSSFTQSEPVNIHVLLNLGSENFSSPELVIDDLNFVSKMALSDLNLDGFPDLVLSRRPVQYGSNTSLLNPPINNYIHVYYNDGTGQFLDPELIYTGGGFFNQLSFPDLDSDADPDIVLSSTERSTIYVIPNHTYAPVRVSGEIFLDENQNGIKDSTETYPNWLEITSDPQAANYFLTDSGHYFLSYGNYEETYTISPQLPASWGISTEAESYTFTIDSDFSELDTLDFGIYPLEELPNLEVNLTGGIPRCNLDVPYWIEIDNQGTTVNGGIIHLVLDDLLDYVWADVAPDSIIGQNIYWHFDSLGYYEDAGFVVTVGMPNFQSIGELMVSTLEAVVAGEGESLYYFADTLTQSLGCAYDPNDKHVEPDQDHIPSGQELDYLIRFQNTGNDTAFTVIITDDLSSNLDWSSFQVVASSHEMDYAINDAGVLILTFVGIQLPDSNVNQIGSQGFARFRITAIGDLLPNTAIHNTARIYFDFNPAIITNTVTSNIECYIAPAPFIGFEFPFLFSGVPEGVSYQWYLDGDPIFGATDHAFTPQISGSYNVEVWDQNGCSTLSEGYLLQGVNTHETERLTLHIYPIPSSGAVHFDFGQDLVGNHHLTIYNYQGKDVKQLSGLSGNHLVIPEGLLENGFYIANIRNTRTGQEVVREKFIISGGQ